MVGIRGRHRGTGLLLEGIDELLDIVTLVQPDSVGGEGNADSNHKCGDTEMFHAVDAFHVLGKGVGNSGVGEDFGNYGVANFEQEVSDLVTGICKQLDVGKNVLRCKVGL